MRALNIPAQTTRPDVIKLGGGLDLLTPILDLKPGYLRDSLNFEQSINGGYGRIGGYERSDGRPAPSLAQYGTLTVNITGAIAVGNTITGVTSGATGKVISVDGALVAYTKSTGSFQAGETLNVGGIGQGTITELGGVGMAPDWDVTQRSLAANVYRADILAVPGSGIIRGVADLGGVRYAWRNNAGGTAMAIYKATISGWTLVPLPFEVTFTAGSTAYVAGGTLTQGGVNATIRAVSVESGSWGSSTAAGRLIITAPTGGNFAAGAAVGGGVATLSGVQVAVALLPGGRVQTDKGNFGGGQKLYGCDGVNRGFEFDGTTLVPINTGNAPDVPTQVLVHKDLLWFGFGENLQNSSIASTANLYPQFNWTATLGSVAYRVNGRITSLLRQGGDQSSGAMSISTSAATYMLYGSTTLNFQLVPFEESAGAVNYSGQRVGNQSIVLSGIGVFAISATQAFGNFTPASLTANIAPFIETRRNQCTASLEHRTKSQYRAFFGDGFGLFMTMVNGKRTGVLPVYFPNKVTCACQGDLPDGSETSFFGSDNGFVYQLDSGTSFDGADIEAYGTLTFAFQGSPMQDKRYRGASFEIKGGGYAEFSVTYELGYGTTERVQGTQAVTGAVELSSLYWDSSVLWDTLVWDGRNLAPSEFELNGTANNISIRFDCTSSMFAAFTINSLVLLYSPRKARKK